MKLSLQSPHRTRRVQLADNDVSFPLRQRYRLTNYTLEGREEAKRSEGETDAPDGDADSVASANSEAFQEMPPRELPAEENPVDPNRTADASIGDRGTGTGTDEGSKPATPPATKTRIIPPGAWLDDGQLYMRDFRGHRYRVGEDGIIIMKTTRPVGWTSRAWYKLPPRSAQALH